MLFNDNNFRLTTFAFRRVDLGPNDCRWLLSPIQCQLQIFSLFQFIFIMMSPLPAATFELQIVDVQTVCEEFKLSSALAILQIIQQIVSCLNSTWMMQ